MDRKYYAIKKGRQAPIIFREWEFCQEAIHTFPGARYKSFKTLNQALKYLDLTLGQVTLVEDGFGVEGSTGNSVGGIGVEANANASSSASLVGNAGETYKKPYQLIKPEIIKLAVYTDGSCTQLGTSRALAGSGIYFPALELKMACPVPGTQTQNRGEIWAVIQALEFASHLPGPPEVEIRLDSTYVKDNLESNNIENLDLWEKLLKLVKEIKVSWVKVLAHSGDSGNDQADKLAKSVAQASSCKVFMK